MYIVGTYDFDRVRVDLNQCTVVSPRFVAAVGNALESPNPKSDRSFLSCNGDGSKVDLYCKDDGSGRQRWEIIPAPYSPLRNTYLIRVSGGVSSNKGYLSCSADGTIVDLYVCDDCSGRQRWQIRNVWVQQD